MKQTCSILLAQGFTADLELRQGRHQDLPGMILAVFGGGFSQYNQSSSGRMT